MLLLVAAILGGIGLVKYRQVETAIAMDSAFRYHRPLSIANWGKHAVDVVSCRNGRRDPGCNGEG